MGKKRDKPKTGGPYVAAALISEHVLLERDDVASVIRIVDRITLVPPPQQTPTGSPPDPVETDLILFVAIKSGDATGEHTLRVDTLTPSGRRRAGFEIAVNMLGGAQGVNIRARLPVFIQEPGLHWYLIRLDGKVLTRTPLEIVHETPKQVPEPSPERSAGEKV